MFAVLTKLNKKAPLFVIPSNAEGSLHVGRDDIAFIEV